MKNRLRFDAVMIIIVQLICQAGSDSGRGIPSKKGFDLSSTSAERSMSYCRMINTQTISSSFPINRTKGGGHGNNRNEDNTRMNHDFDVVYYNEEVRSEMTTILVDIMSFVDAE